MSFEKSSGHELKKSRANGASALKSGYNNSFLFHFTFN